MRGVGCGGGRGWERLFFAMQELSLELKVLSRFNIHALGP